MGKHLHFTLVFTGVVQADGHEPGAEPMTVHELRQNLEALVHMAVGEGDVTGESPATLDAYDYHTTIEQR